MFKLFKRRNKVEEAMEQAAEGQREVVNKSLDQSFKAYVIRQFMKNKLALFSFYFASTLAFVAIFADFIANEKPIVAQYQGSVYFPVMKDYSVSMGMSEWPKQFQNVTWKDLEFDWAIWPLVPYLPQNMDFMNSQFTSPLDDQDVPSTKWTHWLGTDSIGRDVLSGMIHGTRIAFLVGIISMSISGFIGIFLGALAGYFGDDGLKVTRVSMIFNVIAFVLGLFYGFGTRDIVLAEAFSQSVGSGVVQILISFAIFFAFMLVANLISKLLSGLPWLRDKVNVPMDMIITRLIEIIVSVPKLILIMSIVAIVKPSIFIVMVIIGLTSWTGIARFIRAELLKVRNLEFMEAANALGFSNFRSLAKHAIPNALSPVFIAIAFGIAAAILIESTLSFLGIGVAAETITWGKLLSIARSAPDAWWLAIFPGFAIFITVTIFNLIGEGLTDALDPRLKK